MENTTQKDISPEEAKSMLGFGTHLMGQLMPQEQNSAEAPTEASESPETAPGSTEQPEIEETQEPEETIDVDEIKGEFDTKLEELRKEVQDSIKKEMSTLREDIKRDIKDALRE